MVCLREERLLCRSQVFELRGNFPVPGPLRGCRSWKCYQGKMADPSADDVKPLKTEQGCYWLSVEEAEREIKAHEEKTGTRYNVAKVDPSFGSSCKYDEHLPPTRPASPIPGTATVAGRA